MNPSRRVHAITIKRVNTTPVNGVPPGTLATIATGVACELEPLPTKERDSEFGQTSLSTFVVTAGASADLCAQDIVVVEATDRTPAAWVGMQFEATRLIDESGRATWPFKTAWLAERG